MNYITIIKEKLINNEKKKKKLIDYMIKYYGITNNKDLIDDLTILFKAKKYEMDINCIIYFFWIFSNK